MEYDDDDEALEEFDDTSDRRDVLQGAMDLVDLLNTLLQAAATRMNTSTSAERRQYQRDQRNLARMLRPLGIRHPFHWLSLDQGLAAAKHLNYVGRRSFYQDRADPAIEQLQRRLDDVAVGDIGITVADLGNTATATIADTAAIRLELRRIEAALPTDPGAAIGKAKNLIEATAKAILTDLNQPRDLNSDLPGLVTQAMMALGIDSQAVADHDRALARVMKQTSGLA
ncbi:hypothetical protein ACIA8C_36755 [Nocardia sp. NPDC051321]|uniref:hypothetical protein n=1 Tax=Nocardia sp. NPDC051321 TaxID=3364323 RepID=UPI0037A13872